MKSELIKIKNIDVSDRNSWKGSFFVSTDIDWTCDEVINYCTNFFSELNVRVTWFATHKTSLNKEIETQKFFDVGTHPNFNFALNGKDNRGIEGGAELENDIPKGSVIRSNSTTQNSPLLELFHEMSFTDESNLFIPIDSISEVVPFTYYNGLIRVPYIWSDDVHLAYGWGCQQIIDLSARLYSANSFIQRMKKLLFIIGFKSSAYDETISSIFFNEEGVQLL